MNAQDPIERHFRLTPPQKSALKRLGLLTIEDLLRHFPSRYEVAGSSTTTRALTPGQKVTLFGVLSKLKAKKLWKSRRNITEGVFEDQGGTVRVMWFNQPYMASYVAQGTTVKLTGTVGGSAEKPYIANPEVEAIPLDAIPEGIFGDGSEAAPRVFPVYPESRGISTLWFFHAIERLFSEGAQRAFKDPIPEEVRTRYNLPDLETALLYIHTPEKLAHAEAARKRFAFEEIFVMQVARALERRANDAEPAFSIPDAGERAEKFLGALEIEPTGAQRRAIGEIIKDFASPHPMARLLEGDVGAGKTLVAAAASYAVVTSRPPARQSGTLQVAYMAPTEILAEQHFQSFVEHFSDLPINIGLITGSGCKKFPSKIARGKATDISRSQFLKWVGNGEIAMVVGTHALIQKSVKFQHLALAIVDEQHRFGTRQRRALAHKGDAAPHFLSMTATPIPRTLALTLYGDLDISVLDELPPGRRAIETKLVTPDKRGQAYEAIRRELEAGHQAFVICPRIEEPDPAKINALQAKSAKAEHKRLQKEVFPEYEVGLLHGSMKPKEKDEVMARFSKGDIDVLVATSVVEVGVNVPNATVILIEGAERFGLAQLHQLRGRVMRSSHQPYCFLLPETKGDVSMKRLRALEDSSDGFKLAQLDLENRGAGDLFGRKQWGVSDIGMEALKNLRLIQAAREEAQQCVVSGAIQESP
ncbi:MAG TPA: ATP-dependent DNA helicase RecG, partial [Candidatus Paceibacterota bacterium]|nr:ATP-dependent DNA helicase RecG [Candidatus Paceibacterota bacterium]